MTVLNKLRNTNKWTVMLEKVAHGVLLWTFIQHLFQHMLRNLFSFFYLEMLNQVQHDGLRGNTQFNVVSHPASVLRQVIASV
jgi:hypothetical protein